METKPPGVVILINKIEFGLIDTLWIDFFKCSKVAGLIEDKTDGITSDIALVMLEAITKSQLNNVTASMVSKAISTLKKEVEQL